MIRRIFHVLYALCFIWIMALVWNWAAIANLEGVGPILVIAAIPVVSVFVLYYILGKFIDLF